MSRTALTSLFALIISCAASLHARAQGSPASCSTAGKNLYVRDVMNDLYLWSSEVPEGGAIWVFAVK